MEYQRISFELTWNRVMITCACPVMRAAAQHIIIYSALSYTEVVLSNFPFIQFRKEFRIMYFCLFITGMGCKIFTF